MNVWFNSKYLYWELPVINYFKNTGQWKNVIWTSPENSDTTFVDYSCMCDVKYNYHPIPSEFYDKIYKHLYVFCDMYSRNSCDGSQNFYDGKNIHDYLNIFNILVQYYYEKLLTNEINLVIFTASPHNGSSFLQYLIAKELNINVLILEQSIFPNKFYCITDHFDYGDFSTSKKTNEYFAEYTLKRQFKKDLSYMKGFLPKDLKKSKKPLKKLSQAFSKYSLLIRQLKKGNKIANLNEFILNSNYAKNLNKSIDYTIDLNKKFVYFPLHLQPEKTTSAYGGIFADQLLAVERLRQIIPEDWFIYVKENPKQKAFMRGRWFFERLKAIPNTKLVPMEMDTYALIERSEFVSTISGTVGWEAISGGKNVLVFGWGVWYKKFPGVFTYNSNLKIEEILSYTINHQELEEEVRNHFRILNDGVIYKGYEVNVENFDKQKNIETVINSLSKFF